MLLMPTSHPPLKKRRKKGERTLRSKRIRKRQINNQLDSAESADDDGNPTFADPDHAEEDKEEEETVLEKTVTPLVEQRAEELAAATAPPQPTLSLTSLQKLEALYGTALHYNDGTQLDGGIANDNSGSPTGKRLSHSRPSATTSRRGESATSSSIALAEELEGVEGSRWNSKRFIVFQAVILQRMTEVRRVRDIHQRVER